MISAKKEHLRAANENSESTFTWLFIVRIKRIISYLLAPEQFRTVNRFAYSSIHSAHATAGEKASD